jgi:plastocyanin
MTHCSGGRRLGPWVALLAALSGAALSGAALMIDASPRLARAQGRADVAIVDVAYQPGSIKIQAGDTVTWTNTGTTPHTVTADDGSVDSGSLAPRASFSHTFPAAGLFTYHCAIHPQMTGAVTITRAPDLRGDPPVHQVPRTGTGTPVPTEPVPMAVALGAATALGIGAVMGRRRTR